jgi:ElaB protein
MKRHNSTAAVSENLEALAEDAKALMAATADVAEEKVVNARKRLAEALEKGRERVVHTAKATDELIREHPYHAMGVAFGAGALVAFLLSRRH